MNSKKTWILMLMLGICVKMCYSRLNTTIFHMHISSRRSETNKWNILTTAHRRDPKGLEFESKKVIMDVIHSLRNKNGTLSSTLELKAMLNMDSSFYIPTGATAFSYKRIIGLGMYKMHTEGAKWEEAKEICEKEHGHLLVINSQAEANMLKVLVKENQHKISHADYKDYFFLGFHDNSGEFITIQGKPVRNSGYNKWIPGSPRGWNGENCGAANIQGLLLDTYCSNKLAFICESDNR